MKITRILTVAALTTFAACGSSKEGEKKDTATTAAATPEGHWKSDCFTSGEGNQAQHVVLDFNISKDRWTLDYIAHADDKCAQPFLTNHIEGPYKVGNASASVAGAYEGEFGFDKKWVKPHVDAAVAVAQGACGGGEFAVGKETDILEKGCPGFGAYPRASCANDYDLVKIEGDTLKFGKRPADNNMCTPEKRPTELSPLGIKKL